MCWIVKNLRNILQQFLMKCVNVCVKFYSTNEEVYLFNGIGFKCFQTALRASAVDVIKRVSENEGKILIKMLRQEKVCKAKNYMKEFANKLVCRL